MDGVVLPEVCGDFEVRVEFPDLRLLPNSYSISLCLLESGAIGAYDRKESWKKFRVYDSSLEIGPESGLFLLPHRWSIYTPETPADSAKGVLTSPK